MATSSKRLLWSDDEGPGRFRYAAHRLKAAGWEVTWANSVSEAADLLRTERFDALLLDQMLPMGPSGARSSVWGGCSLLRWIKGRPVAPAAPPTVESPQGVPLECNKRLSFAIVTAYAEEAVEAAMREVLEEDEDLHILNKPLDIAAVLGLLDASELARP